MEKPRIEDHRRRESLSRRKFLEVAGAVTASGILLSCSDAQGTGGSGSVTVSSISPPAAVPGATVTVSGTGFEPGQDGSCGGIDVPMTHVDSTTKTFTVPEGINLNAKADVTVAGVTLQAALTPLVFGSDFGGGVGATRAAVTDNGRWNGNYSNNDAEGEVISAAGLNFPSLYCLRITAIDTCFVRACKTGLPVPGIGESLYFRWYFRAAHPNGLSDSSNHPIEGTHSGGSSARNWAWRVWHTDADAWHMDIGMEADGTGWATPGGGLRKDVTYRFEMQITRTGQNTCEIHARVYDWSDTLIYDDSDFVYGSASLADAPSHTLPSPDDLTDYQVGNNGLGAGGWSNPTLMYYQGAFAVSTADWCGPYRPGEAG